MNGQSALAGWQSRGENQTLREPPVAMSRIDLPKIFDSGSFARYVPFDDKRQVIVRRGKELGFHYGLEVARREVSVEGRSFPLVRYQTVISPPPIGASQTATPPGAGARYRPQTDVLYLEDAEVAIADHPDGFSEAEVATIIAAIRITR